MAVTVVDGVCLMSAPAQPAALKSTEMILQPTPLTNGRNAHEHQEIAVERRHRDGLSWDYLAVSLSSEEAGLVEDFQRHVLPRARPDWSRELLRHRVFEEGVSNKLVGFFQEGAPEETAVLVRVNGEGRELVVDGETEVLVMLTLHRAGLCPPLYLVTENALCYGYIPGRALTGREMQCEDVLEATSRALAQFHSIPPPPSLRGAGPWVWSQLERWMTLVSHFFHDTTAPQRFKQVFGTVDEMRQEMEWLKSFLRTPTAEREDDVRVGWSLGEGKAVLCHNDPQPLNFVLTPKGGVVLIDMEYSCVNHPAFDICCFFCEFAGVHGTVDYSRYPSETVQKKWIYNYLHECARIKGMDGSEVTSEEVDRLCRESNLFTLAAHFVWSLWSLIQYKTSTIQFGYLEYGCVRYAEYKRRKAFILTHTVEQ